MCSGMVRILRYRISTVRGRFPHQPFGTVIDTPHPHLSITAATFSTEKLFKQLTFKHTSTRIFCFLISLLLSTRSYHPARRTKLLSSSDSLLYPGLPLNLPLKNTTASRFLNIHLAQPCTQRNVVKRHNDVVCMQLTEVAHHLGQV